MDFLEKVKGFLTEPSKTFDAVKDEPLEEAVKYYAIIAVVYSALLALMFAFAGSLMGPMMGLGMMGAGAGIGAAVITFVTFLIFAIASAFIGGAILHIFVYIVGGRKGIVQTIKAVMYGLTPTLLLGWIPFINFIAMIWSLVVEIIGIRQLHELTTGRAVLALVLLIVASFILAFIFAAVMTAFILGMGGRSPYGY